MKDLHNDRRSYFHLLPGDVFRILQSHIIIDRKCRLSNCSCKHCCFVELEYRPRNPFYFSFIYNRLGEVVVVKVDEETTVIGARYFPRLVRNLRENPLEAIDFIKTCFTSDRAEGTYRDLKLRIVNNRCIVVSSDLAECVVRIPCRCVIGIIREEIHRTMTAQLACSIL